MNKTQKWIYTLMLISPIIAILILMITTDRSIKGLPLWFVIGLPLFVFAVFLISFFEQRHAQKKPKDVSLQKARKRFLIGWGSYAIFIAIILTIAFFFMHNPTFIWQMLFTQIGLLLFLFFFLYPKKKDFLVEDDQNN